MSAFTPQVRLVKAIEIPLSIESNKKALDKASEEYKTLRNIVKKVLSAVVAVVGLIKDRACAEDDFPSKKKNVMYYGLCPDPLYLFFISILIKLVFTFAT